MHTNVSDKLLEEINYFGGKLSIIRDVVAIILSCIENDEGVDVKITSLVNMLNTNVLQIYKEYSDFTGHVEYPDN